MTDLLENFRTLKAEAAVRKVARAVLTAMTAGTMTEDEAYAALARATAESGADAFAIWTCQECSARNRVDKARAVAFALQPKCGRCRAVLMYP
jgi:hypothetical protein